MNCFIRLLIIFALLLLLNYIRWRIFFLLNNYSIITLIYTISEVFIMFFGSINTYFIAWNANIPLTKPIDINKIKNLPFIEIYLLCCKEPFDIIKNSSFEF